MMRSSQQVSNMLNIILLGPPASGKGSNAKEISKYYKIPHISTGDMFREAIKAKTELGVLAKSYIDKGLLVPDEVTIGLVKERIKAKDCTKGFLLDGFPRTLGQAEAMTKIGKELKKEITHVIELTSPEDLLVWRICGRRVCPNCGTPYHIHTTKPKKEGICDKCGSALIQRKDDNEETFRARLGEYHKQTEPLIGYYTKLGLLHKIDGSTLVEDSIRDIKQVLGER